MLYTTIIQVDVLGAWKKEPIDAYSGGEWCGNGGEAWRTGY